ncbi:Hpt domain-containing protein [Lysobacter xanthus]
MAALAHTAAREADEHERLLAAGFLEVLVKPLSTPDVVAAVRALLGRAPPPMTRVMPVTGAPLWDDEAALRAVLGERAHLVALRRLFRDELVSMRDAARTAMEARDAAALRALLHRLRASCGFVGATRLGEAATRLATEAERDAWNQFEATIAGTLASFPER